FRGSAIRLYHGRSPSRAISGGASVAAENETLDRVSEAVLPVATRHEICRAPHLGVCIAHRNAQSTPLEHGDIVGAVTDDGDLLRWNRQEPRELRKCGPFVGEWRRNVEVVGLRTGDEGLTGEHRTHIAFTHREVFEIL